MSDTAVSATGRSGSLDPQTVRRFIQASPVPMIGLDPRSRLIDCSSPAVARILGYAPEELAGQHLEVLHRDPPPGERSIPAVCDALLDEKTVRAAWQLRHRDGRAVVCNLQGGLLLCDPQPLAFLVFCDATQEEQQQGAFEADQEFGQALLKNLSEGVVACNKEGRLVLLNSVNERYYGAQGDAVPKEQWAERYGLYAADGQTLLNLEQIPLYRALKGEAIVGEEMVLKPAGHAPRHVLVNCTPIRNTAGDLLGAVCVDYNITEIKKAGDEARRLAAIVEHSGDAIIGMDVEGRIVSWNRGAQSLYDYAAEEMIGHSPDRLAPERSREDFRRLLARAERGEEIAPHETTHATRHGQLLRVGLSISIVRDSAARPIGLSMICQDVSRQREQQEQWNRDEKMRSIATLAGGVAHDFNNILVSVLGNASMIQAEMPPDHRWYEPISSVVSAAEQAAAVTRQLLAYSRSGEFAPRPVSLQNVLSDSLSLCRSAMPAGVRLDLEPRADHDQVLLDPTQTQQILLNLTMNSAESMPDGGRIYISTRTCTAPADTDLAGKQCACVHVRDEGTGVDADIADRLFEPFSTKKELGRGLGLASVYGMLKNHGAEIQLVSAPGESAEFVIFFPLLQLNGAGD